MSEFELLRNITIGQYLPTDSVVHRLDPRVKLVGGVLLLAAVMFNSSGTGLALALMAVLGVLALAQIPLRHALRGLWSAWLFFVMVALLQLIFYPHAQAAAEGSTIFWRWGPLMITGASLRLLAILLGRLVALILLVSGLTFCTTVTELSHGAERLLRPLQRVGVPAHELALVLTLTLRFLPLLAREMERLIKAQISRGADFGGSRWNFVQRARRMFPLLIPLFVTSLRRAEDLIQAMEARCYLGGRGRTHLIQLQAQPIDFVALALVTAFVVIIFVADFAF
jgi:energy-coupling factor transport system permease protein